MKQPILKRYRKQTLFIWVFFAVFSITNFAGLALAQSKEQSLLQEWQDRKVPELLRQGVSAQTAEELLSAVVLDARLIKTNTSGRALPKLPIWRFLELRVTYKMLAGAKRNLKNEHRLLTELETQYGVDKAVLVAIWGMESFFGTAPLDYNANNSLATLACCGHRRAFFDRQYDALVKLIDDGKLSRADLKCSWDGGLGQTQFMPLTLMEYGVDTNNNGQFDLASDKREALASAAHYLSELGYRSGVPILLEINSSNEITEKYARTTYRSKADWEADGVSTTGVAGEAGDEFRIYRPSGMDGPHFLASKNFDAIKTYNGSHIYALSIWLITKE